MWASLFATAVAAAVCLSAVNLASEINKIQEARHLAVVEHSGRARALFFEQGGLQPPILIAMANGANGLRG